MKPRWPGLNALALAGLFVTLLHVVPWHAARMPFPRQPPAVSGIRFTCSPVQLARVERDMDAYLAELGVSRGAIVKQLAPWRKQLTYTLNTAARDTSTLDLSKRPEYGISTEAVMLPTRDGTRRIQTVSRTEIMLALLQHGRLTEMTGKSCSVAVLRDMIGVRQNIVAWAEHLEWGWPDGGAASWNTKYWNHGTPLPTQALPDALLDMFLHQDLYVIGCYTATKMVVVHGTLDYYRRVNPNAEKLRWLEMRLLSDGEPLVDIEPGRMWSFEDDFDPRENARPGKLLQMQEGVAEKNFVPGDWAYLLNPDPLSRQKSGYEGSNAIYLGAGRFDDYYNDHHHSFSFEDKLDEVYQWRHGVFSRLRDAHKRQPLTAQALALLSRSPARGGLVFDWRAVPAHIDLLEHRTTKTAMLPP